MFSRPDTMPRVEKNPHYGPCPKRPGGTHSVVKMVDPGDVCSVCLNTEFLDGRTYLILPCGHYFCRTCVRKMTKTTEEGYEPDGEGEGGIVVDRLRCHCGLSYGEGELANAREFRALVRGQVIELSDDYVNVKEEPVEYL